MESDHENEDEINSDGEFWKSEPIEGYNIRPRFIPLLPFEEHQISKLKRLRDLNMDDRGDFIEATHIRSDIISDVLAHVFEI